MTTPNANPVYTLSQAEEDLANTQGAVDLMNEYQAIGGLTIDGQAGPLGTGQISGPDTGWHNASLVNGWTGTLSYRITAQGDLQIHADLVTGTTTNGTTICTFPTAYRPAAKARIPCAFDGTAATGGNPYFILNIDGTFTVHWVTSTQTNGGFEAVVRMA